MPCLGGSQVGNVNDSLVNDGCGLGLSVKGGWSFEPGVHRDYRVTCEGSSVTGSYLCSIIINLKIYSVSTQLRIYSLGICMKWPNFMI